MSELTIVATPWDAEIEELRRLEEAVRQGDAVGLRARLESGRYLLTLKNGKEQLPPGLLARLSKAKFGRTEIDDRMRFAEKCQTETEFTDFIGKFPTWYAVTHGGLTTKPRGKKKTNATTGSVKATSAQTNVAAKVQDDDQDAQDLQDDLDDGTNEDTDNAEPDDHDAQPTTGALRRVRAILAGLHPATLLEGDRKLLTAIRQHVRRLESGEFVANKRVVVVGTEATL